MVKMKFYGKSITLQPDLLMQTDLLLLFFVGRTRKRRAINLSLLLRSNNFLPLSRPNVNRDLIRLVIYLFHISEHLIIIESFA